MAIARVLRDSRIKAIHVIHRLDSKQECLIKDS
ncbi:hypothetical protein HALO153_190088 [Vreelandella titanicae]|nr:hypothetical protein HALO153_190088 [Halomonas titanicae]VXC63519.1 hypothetical protein HALO98_90088 [Halomonas titanicae]